MSSRIPGPRIGKRGALYIALFVVTFLGGVSDFATGTAYSEGFTVTDIAMMVGTVILIAWWCTVDARGRGRRYPTSLARICTLLFAPLGLAIYLLQSRSLPRAAGLFILFVGGLAVASFTGSALGERLFPFTPP